MSSLKTRAESIATRTASKKFSNYLKATDKNK